MRQDPNLMTRTPDGKFEHRAPNQGDIQEVYGEIARVLRETPRASEEGA